MAKPRSKATANLPPTRHYLQLITVGILVVLLGNSGAAAASKPTRIVSLNVCTDQLILMLADPRHVASITFLALDPDLSAMAKVAAMHHINHGNAEEILTLEPDLVVAGEFSTRPTVELLRRLNYRVEEFGIATTLADARAQIQRMAQILGEGEKGSRIVQEMDAKIQAAARHRAGADPVAVIYRPNGFSAGANTLEHAVLTAAGYRNLSVELGFAGVGRIELEDLIAAGPDLLVMTAYDGGKPSLAQEILIHPVFRKLASRTQTLSVPNSYWACAGPKLADAVRLIAAASHD